MCRRYQLINIILHVILKPTTPETQSCSLPALKPHIHKWNRSAAQLSLPLPPQLDVSTRDVNLIGQRWGQTAIDWLVIRRERPGGSIKADTVNTELRRVDRSLTNGHRPTGTRPLTQQLPAIPYCQAAVSKGSWCVAVLIPAWDTAATLSDWEPFLAVRIEPLTSSPQTGGARDLAEYKKKPFGDDAISCRAGLARFALFILYTFFHTSLMVCLESAMI